MTASGNGGASRKQVGRPFQPGQSGNPAGRPKGSRHKLTSDFLRELANDFEKHGASAIVDVRSNRPHDYLKICASLIPRGLELDVQVGPSAELKTALAGFISDYAAVRDAVHRIGADPEILQAVTINDDDDE